jgi:hypothetical protein
MAGAAATSPPPAAAAAASANKEKAASGADADAAPPTTTTSPSGGGRGGRRGVRSSFSSPSHNREAPPKASDVPAAHAAGGVPAGAAGNALVDLPAANNLPWAAAIAARPVLVAAFKALAVLLVWKCLLLAWTWSTPMATEHHYVPDPSVIVSTTTGKIMTVVDVERRIRELEARHNVDLQRQLDEYDGILQQIRQARQDLQPLRERVEHIRRQGAAAVAAMAAESTLDPTVLGDEHDADAAIIVTFPHLEALVSHLRQRQAGFTGDNDDKDDDDDTARVRELFFRARKELYEHSQQQSSAASMEGSEQAGASPPRRGNNYTRANAILQSYADLTNWGDMLPPPRCPAPSDAIDAAALLLSSALTPAQIDEWMASNPDVQDRIEHVQQLIADRTAVDDREWKVGLEATYEKVQERYMELAVQSNQAVFRTMKELQEHLDHWEVREAQKGITSNNPSNSDLQAAKDKLGVCVQTSQVLHWIEVGLDAHYRNRSVREAIATALLHDGALDKDHVQRAAEDLVPDPVPEDDDSNINLRFRRGRRRRYLRLLLDGHSAAARVGKVDRPVRRLDRGPERPCRPARGPFGVPRGCVVFFWGGQCSIGRRRPRPRLLFVAGRGVHRAVPCPVLPRGRGGHR